MSDFNWDDHPIVSSDTGSAAKAFSWDDHPIVGAASAKEEPSGASGKAQTALEHFANGASFGYLPQLQAAAEPAMFKIGNWLTGDHVEPDSYVDARDQNVKRLDSEAKDNPKTAIGSELAGATVSALAIPTPGALAAKGITGGMIKGAGVGAAYGALQNPGDVEGKIDPIQADERRANAEKGGAIGAITGGVTQGAAKVLSKLQAAPEALSQLSNEQAVKASGAMLKDFRALEGQNRTQAIGQFAHDNGLVKAGDTLEDVAGKAENLNKEAGQRLQKIYQGAQEQIEKQGGATTGFNPTADKDQIVSQVQKALGNQVGKGAALGQVSSYLDQLIADHGDKILDPKIANDIEGEVSQKIKYARDPRTPEPTAEAAFKELRSIVSDKVDAQVKSLGEASGNAETAAQLAQANRDYGLSKQISGMAKDKINRVLANNRFSLTDRIAGGAGGVVGGAAGGIYGDDWRSEGIGAMGGTALGALTNHFGGQYGNAAIAAGLRGASKMAQAAAPAVGTLSRVANPETANVATRAVSGTATLPGELGKAPNSATPENEDLRPTKVQPQKGPSSWANKGMQNILKHSPDDKDLIANKAQLLNDPKTRDLLIKASDLKPGTRAMDNILSRIKEKIKAASNG